MRLSGVFEPPGDKSISHRIALLSLMAKGRCSVSNYSTAQDCITSVQAVNLLGGSALFSHGNLDIIGANRNLKDSADIDCQNSGTTMRLLMGILAGVQGRYTLCGDESLMKRPMERVAKPLRSMGAKVECAPSGIPPVTINGSNLGAIDYVMPVASAQLKSAVLLAGIQAAGLTKVTEPIKSRDHTERLLQLLGANISCESNILSVEKSELELPATFNVPGDPSSAAFFICGAAMSPGSEVITERMLLNPTRANFLDKLRSMGVNLDIEEQGHFPEPWGRVRSRYSKELSPCLVSAEELPLLVDEVPILALLATQARGVSVFHEIAELRIKESDRVAAVVTELGRMGARLEIVGDNLFVHGPTRLKPADKLESFGDHRIAMTLAIAKAVAGSSSSLNYDPCVAISYPNFFETMKELTQCKFIAS